jgi:hypothetical protein
MSAALWVAFTLLLIWVIIRDRSIWPMIAGRSVGAPWLVDSYELSWLPSELISIFKKHMSIAIPKLKKNAKEQVTQNDIEQFEMMMKQFSDDPTLANAMGSPPPPETNTAPGTTTSGYIIPPAWMDRARNVSNYMPSPAWVVTGTL